MSVQIGFVAGTLLAAVTNLPDRVPTQRLIAAATVLAALANGAIALLPPALPVVLALRFLTGFALAGVYPPGMKFAATWCREDRGLGIGLLVGSLTLGKSLPHLINAMPWFGSGGMPPWRTVVIGTSWLALLAGLVAATSIRPGPFLSRTAPFDWRVVGRAISDRPTRLANFGYLGHMWELYAMWAWVPLFLIASYAAADRSPVAARLAGFGTLAAGAVGCVLAGMLADRLGRTSITIWSLGISGACCVLAGPLFDRPGWLTALCLVWGFAVVADSAQFSAAVSELTDPLYVGTALTLQTCLGFLLTLGSLRLVPYVVERVGWERVFTILALGPVFGILSMARLRRLSESTRMAAGRR